MDGSQGSPPPLDSSAETDDVEEDGSVAGGGGGGEDENGDFETALSSPAREVEDLSTLMGGMGV